MLGGMMEQGTGMRSGISDFKLSFERRGLHQLEVLSLSYRLRMNQYGHELSSSSCLPPCVTHHRRNLRRIGKRSLFGAQISLTYQI